MSTNEDIDLGKGMMDRLAVAHLAELRCFHCDYATLKLLLTPREDVSYVVARLSLSSTCSHCATMPWRAYRNVVRQFGGSDVETLVYVPLVLHSRFLDGSWLKDARGKYAVIATMSQTLRDVYDIEEEISVYGHSLDFVITALRTWIPTLYHAEAASVYGCGGLMQGHTTRWMPYRKDSPLQLAIEQNQHQTDEARMAHELNCFHMRGTAKPNKPEKDKLDKPSEEEEKDDGAGALGCDAQGEHHQLPSLGHDEPVDDGVESGSEYNEPAVNYFISVGQTKRDSKRAKARSRQDARATAQFDELNRPENPKLEKEKIESAIKELEAQLKKQQHAKKNAEKAIAAMRTGMLKCMQDSQRKDDATAAHRKVVVTYDDVMADDTDVPHVKGQTVPLTDVGDDRVKVNEHRPGDDKRSLEKAHATNLEEPERKAALIGPMTNPVVLHEENPANAYEAIRQRMLKAGARDFTASPAVQKKLRRTTEAYIKAFLNPQKVRKAFHSLGGMDGCKPNSWSDERWWAALTKLIEGELPRNFQMTIKPEAAAPGKAPRPISNEGDLWQAMNSVIFKVCELLDSTTLTFHNVKHKDLGERHSIMKEVAGLVTGIITEGDGSAWEASCGPEIQKLIEQPVFMHIADIIYDIILEYPPLAKDAAIKRRAATGMKYDMYTKADFEKSTLRQKIGMRMSFVQRSSGDSGTSYLNRLVNMIGWVVAVAAKPEELIVRMTEKAPWYECLFDKDKHGKPVWKQLGCFFEGDDSLIMFNASVKAHRDKIEKYWKSIGFNMKLKFIDDSTEQGPAEFCGYHYWVVNGKLTGVCMPDGARSMRNAQLSVSKQALKSPEDRDSVAASAAYGRYCALSHGCPILADAFLARAEAYGGWSVACGRLHESEKKDFMYRVGTAYTHGEDLSPEVLEEAMIAQRGYYSNPDAHIPLAKSSLKMSSCHFSVLAGAAGLTHTDHPDMAAAYCQK